MTKNGYLAHLLACIGLLSRRAKIVFWLIAFFQSVISILDLLGLALIMKIILGLRSGRTDTSHMSLPVIGDQFFRFSTNSVLIVIVFIFLIKGLLALTLHAINIRIMQAETIELTSKLTNSIFEFRNTKFRALNSQDIAYTLYNATEMVFRDTLIPAVIILSDAVLLLAISFNLFLNAKILFVPTVTYFVVVFLTLRFIEKKETLRAHHTQLTKEISFRSKVQETNSSLRELYVSSNLKWATQRLIKVRSDGIRAGSVVTLSQLRPKYIYEMALFGGIGLISLVSKLTGNQDLILTYLVLFVVSSSRMVPGLMRIQYYSGIFGKTRELTSGVFAILGNNDFAKVQKIRVSTTALENDSKRFVPRIEVDSLTFSYSSEDQNSVIKNLSLNVLPGESVAIVGKSGAGKSTLVDLMLGYQLPSTGSVKISGLDPRDCFRIWPGKVSYVPQKVTIYEDSLFANIAIGIQEPATDESRLKVLSLIDQVELGEYFRQLPDGLNTKLSESGTSLSGGQIQRIGIARALFSSPQILVLDESTSSLDGSTENAIMNFIHKLRGEVTLIIIAHRLSTIKSADKVYYIAEGKIEAAGSFDAVIELVPDFAEQVKNSKA